MTALPRIEYFLGANAPTGFYSLYDHLLPPEQARAIYILKGGPGCGKSTLMRRVGAWAEEAGLKTEYILCSGDPDSLDGLILPGKAVAIVDGTAPQGVVTGGHYGGFVPFLERKGTEKNFGEKLRFSSNFSLEFPENFDLLLTCSCVLLSNLDSVNQSNDQFPGDSFQLQKLFCPLQQADLIL